MAGETGNEGDGGLDIGALLSPATSGDTETGGNEAGTKGSNGSQEGFKFGGKSYSDVNELGQAANKLYGKYSDQQSTFNQIKEALKDPRLFSQFSKDPKWAPILAKLGIQQATEEFDRGLEEDAQGRESQTSQQLVQQIQVERAEGQLEREEWRFERSLKRDITPEERNAVLQVIARAPSLSYKEAWDLAFHDKMMKEALAKAQTTGKTAGNRPPPLPPGIPGVKLDLKKAIGQMSKDEWRESLRQDLPELLGGSR